MRGFLIVRLQEYIQSRFGHNSWPMILETVQIPTTKLYFSQNNYPDEEFYRIITEAIKLAGISQNQFLEDFGYSLGPTFIKTLKLMIKPTWKVIDVLENIQEFNFHMLQQGEDPVKMGRFQAKRSGPDALQLEYSSPRQLCHLAIGLFKAIANQMGEELEISQSACMLEKADKCLIQVKAFKANKQKSVQFAEFNKSFS